MSVTFPGQRIALPPTGPVAAVAPDAAELIEKHNELQAQLPPRASAEALNELDEVRARVVAVLHDPEVQQTIDDQRRKRRVRMRELIGELGHLWGEEDAARALERWRTQGVYRSSPLGVTVANGMRGYERVVGASALLRQLDALLADAGEAS